MKYVKEKLMSPVQIAETIRRLTSVEISQLADALTNDNMGDKLQFAIASEIQDKHNPEQQRHIDC
jgi:hypothetical protein|tara:strand:- start:608 stop:802 length:195 start_codon:yes stop_codon:yes gene_type:complete